MQDFRVQGARIVLRAIPDVLDIGISLARLYRSDRWTAEEIREHQERALVRQLRYAVTTIPYYRELGISASTIVDADSLQRFPKLDKSIIQQQGERLCNPEIIAKGAFRSLTSGSTGEPTVTWFDRHCWNFCKYALKIRRTLLAGPPWGQRQLLIDESTGRDGSIDEPRRTKVGTFQQIRMSVFTPIETQLQTFLDLRPTVVYGTPSGVRELCDYASQRQVRLPPVDLVFLTSELISDGARQQIEACLGGRVVGIYGSTEFKDLAHQCVEGRYHTYFQSAVIESESRIESRVGRLLITSLLNRAMPLIRFDIGDYAAVGFDRCNCGITSPYLCDIRGREIEFLSLPDGRRLSPYRLTTAVETVPGLLKYQFIQHADLSLRMKAVLAGTGSQKVQQLAQIRSSLRPVLGNETDLPIDVVERIERTEGGKHKIVSSAPDESAHVEFGPK